MRRALPLLTGAALLAALAGCSGSSEERVAQTMGTQGSGLGETAASTGLLESAGSGGTATGEPEASGPARSAPLPSGPVVQHPAGNYAQDRPGGEVTVRIVTVQGGSLGENGHDAYVCKLISTPTISLYSAGGSMSGSGVALTVDVNEDSTTVLSLPAGEINLTAYCTDPGGVRPDFTGNSPDFVVTEGGSTDVEITAGPRP
jgi:hypothetical protein